MRISDWSSDVCSADLSGITRLEHLTQLDLTALLNSQLQYEQQQRLNQLAPSHLEVPTGSRIRLDYQPPDAPTLAVKLQEMFGCLQTPCVNGGRTKVIVHLLSPAQRPIAVPQDLGGFRSEEHTSELQSLMRISYAVFCLKNQKENTIDKPQRRGVI